MNKAIFDHYKNRLSSEGQGKARFNVIQYLCSFPKINPYEMAAALIVDGCEIVYNDSSISKAGNEAHKRAVAKQLKAQGVGA